MDKNALRINYVAVFVAAHAAFVASSVWYVAFAKELTKFSPALAAMSNPPLGNVLIEFVRSLIIAYVLARFAAGLGIADWKGAMGLGVWMWVGFPVVLLAGSIMWEKVPWQLAAIHAGDWLVKLVLIAVIVGAWRRKTTER